MNRFKKLYILLGILAVACTASLKEQMYSLNMRMLLAMQNHDEEAQEKIRKQMMALQKEIDQMCLGSGYRH